VASIFANLFPLLPAISISPAYIVATVMLGEMLDFDN